MSQVPRNRQSWWLAAVAAATLVGWQGSWPIAGAQEAPQWQPARKELRIGIIGLDTSHATAFAKLLNDKADPGYISGSPVVAAFPQGSKDIPSSVSRVPAYTEEVVKLGVRIAATIDEMLEEVDCVLLESNDGRPHLEQAWPVLRAGKPLFIDKPVAGTLADAVAIYDLAARRQVPLFSSSSLRFATGAQALRRGDTGAVLGCDAYSPCALESTHPDLFWYGIHGVETLFTVMGVGCETVSRSHTASTDFATGVWSDGRVGSFRGIRDKASGYGGTAFTEKGIQSVGQFDGYRPLLVEIVEFFRSGKPPVSAEETLQIYTFMEAADESKRRGGGPVSLAEVRLKANAEAERIVKQLSP